MVVKVWDARALPQSVVDEWLDLESRALEPNAYLSPHFVVPALAHLTPDSTVQVVTVLAQSGASTPKVEKMLGLGLFELHPASREFPLPHLQIYHSEHSFLGGLLVDAAQAEPALQALFDYLRQPRAGWDGVKFGNWYSTSKQGQLVQAVAGRCGCNWSELHHFQRATLTVAHTGEALYQAGLKKVGGKDLERRIRRLQEVGPVTSRVLWGEEVSDAVIAQFLHLEDRDWTREGGTSLIAAGHRAFFEAVCRNFRADSRVFVYEVLVDGQAVASAINFSAGGSGFAFKIGWEQSLAKFSPGIINELWFVRDAAVKCAQLTTIDSGASEGSFIDKLWPERTHIATGYFATSLRGRLVSKLMRVARNIKAKIS